MKLRRYPPVALLMLVLHLTGCYSWQPATISPRELLKEEQPGQIRILHADGTRIELRDPRIETDSLTARIFDRLRTGDVRIALSDIYSVEARRISTPLTMGAVVLTGAGLAVALVWASLDRR
jgi:hypothetical protein